MKRLVLLACLVLVGAAIAVAPGEREHTNPMGSSRIAIPISQVGDSGKKLVLESGSERSLGAFGLGRGKTLRLATAQTADGQACLLESGQDDPGSSMCLDGGLFGVRRVAFTVDSQGGPDRFTELRVPGVVAPDIRGAEILKTDGSSAPVALTSTGAFVYESPSADLQRGVYPSGFRLYGPNGKLVETVRFPAGP